MRLSCKVGLDADVTIEPCLLTLELVGSAGEKNYIVKNMIPGEFEYQLDLQKQLSSCPNVRAVVDTIKAPELFIFPFLATDLLRLSQKALPTEIKKNILRSALRGLADMHDRDILHNGKLKPSRRPPSTIILISA